MATVKVEERHLAGAVMSELDKETSRERLQRVRELEYSCPWCGATNPGIKHFLSCQEYLMRIRIPLL